MVNRTAVILWCLFYCTTVLLASEVRELVQPAVQVVVKEHPKTGKPYVSIVSVDAPLDHQAAVIHPQARPDYRLLDPRVKSGEISYEGPYSDRRKVYLFAATLAAVGVAGGAIGMAAASAAPAAGGATSGSGMFLGAGVLTGAGTTAVVRSAHADPQEEDFTLTSEAHSNS